MKSVLDPTFRYTPAVQTDLRKTFARIRRELREQAEAEAKLLREEQAKVVRQINRGRA